MKRVLNISLAINMLKSNLYVYLSQKLVPIEETLMKLNVCLFQQKMINYYINIMKFGKKSAKI